MRNQQPADMNEMLSHWLETQRRVVEHWRERLVAEAGDPVLIGALDQHAAFLRQLDEL